MWNHEGAFIGTPPLFFDAFSMGVLPFCCYFFEFIIDRLVYPRFTMRFAV